MANCPKKISLNDEAPSRMQKLTELDDWFTPQSIYDNMSDVIGNDRLKRQIACQVYSMWQFDACVNSMIIGPSGSGKTQLFRSLASQWDSTDSKFVYIFDASSLTAEGWRGIHLSDFLKIVRADTGFKKHLVVLDEYDKVLYQKSSDCQMSTLIQSNLLAMESEPNISFVLLGAFSELREQKMHQRNRFIGFGTASDATDDNPCEFTFEDFTSVGMMPELLGRLAWIGYTQIPDKPFFMEAAKREVKKLEKLISKHIETDPFLLEELADGAMAAGLGCRKIKNDLYNMVMSEVYEHPFDKQINLVPIEGQICA